MSLVSTLAKVAIGVVVAKGVSGMMKKGKETRGQVSDGGLFGGQNSPQAQPSGSDLEDMMSDILGNKTPPAQGGTGGLGGLLEQLGGTPGTIGAKQGGGLDDLLSQLGGGGTPTGRSQPSQPGGLDDLLGQLTGRSTSQPGQPTVPGGGLGDLLGGLLSAAADKQSGQGGGFGDLLNQAIAGGGEPKHAPTVQQEAMAGLMLRAMIQAAKSDGNVDSGEEQKLLSRLGEVSDQERAFVQAELRAPVDVQGLARQVPTGLEQQVYTMSIMGIDLDNRNEAQYLHQLAQAMGLQPQLVNQLHAQLGVPAIYS